MSFRIHPKSRLFLRLVLIWVRCAYARLPQGLKTSIDFFQAHMTSIFIDFDEILVYVENITLFTKKDFERHIALL